MSPELKHLYEKFSTSIEQHITARAADEQTPETAEGHMPPGHDLAETGIGCPPR